MHVLRQINLTTVIALTLVVLAPDRGYTQKTILEMTGEESIGDIIRAIPSKNVLEPGTISRGETGGGDSRTGSTDAGSSVQPPPPRVSLSWSQITFAFDSAALTPSSKSLLTKIGAAFSAPEVVDRRFLVEGHTDAKGTAEYNMRLSERRAQSVYNYLVADRGISADRLLVSGKGETELLPDAHPNSGRNRRVSFVPLD